MHDGDDDVLLEREITLAGFFKLPGTFRGYSRSNSMGKAVVFSSWYLTNCLFGAIRNRPKGAHEHLLKYLLCE